MRFNPLLTDRERAMMERISKEGIRCPCGYGGEDLKIGRVPISNKMMCSKCKRYFNPFALEVQNDS